MYVKRSHGRLAAIMGVVSIPTAFALGLGIWLSQHLFSDTFPNGPEVQMRQVSDQSRMLADLVTQELEALKFQAYSLAEVYHGLPEGKVADVRPSGKILHWSELTLQAGGVKQAKYWVRSPLWNAGAQAEDDYMKSMVQNLNLSQVEKAGVFVLRLKKDPQGLQEWMSAIYPYRSKQGEKTLIAAVFDPTQLNAFIRWQNHSQGGKIRSYLVGREGKVLVHSQPSLNSSNIRSLSLFSDLAQKVAAGRLQHGEGKYEGVDRLPVIAASTRIEGLPLAVVVEEVQALGVSSLSEWMRWLSGLLPTVFFLALIVYTCSAYLREFLVRVVPITVKTEGAEDLPSRQHREFGGFLSGDDLLILDAVEPKNRRDS